MTRLRFIAVLLLATLVFSPVYAARVAFLGQHYGGTATKFDSTAYASRGAALTGAATGTSGVMSLWFNNPNAASAQHTFFTMQAGNTSNYVVAYIGASGRLVFNAATSTPTNVVNGSMVSINTTIAGVAVTSMGTNWAHYLVSFNTATARCQMYVNNMVEIATGANQTFTSCTSGTIAYTTATNPYLGNGAGPFGPYGNGNVANMADLAYWPNKDLDISDPAARAIFIDGSGHAVNPQLAIAALGSPILRFAGQGNSFYTNLGTGGTFTSQAGTVSAAGSRPN